ncbi:uncharacterized protein LOC114129668 isoform X2 [Aphis gossypii]|uniref:uncharacterized protein LOC114129668 isoform X2 n=1 Tax=Aphis gossypii TaxID=80765 RepID=UPI002158C8B2|nr:uncharacterized protein LOC114129668 isoform X2 [Aphis gossypii]
MDFREENKHVFNIWLAKRVGLYQMFDPGTARYRGKNVYHIALTFIVLYLGVIATMMNVSGIYYWKDNMPISIDYFWKAETWLFVFFKMWIVVYRSTDIWDCLSITRYGFTSFGYRNTRTLDRWRERSVRFTTAVTVIYLTSLVFYMAGSLAFREDVILVKNHDGSVGYYHQNVMNFYFAVSDSTYNAHYNTFFFVEAATAVLLTMLFLIFDILLITMCFATCCQMQLVGCEFESFGHDKPFGDDPRRSPIGEHEFSDYTDERKNVFKERVSMYYDELKTIVLDHQAVIKKYENLLSLFELAMLLQIFVSSITLIILWFIFIMSFSNDDRFVVSDIIVKKMIFLIPSLSYQIYMECYLFGLLHNQKDSVIFALYSSNWTEMCMRCKKLILLTMEMNNANHIKLKFTRTKIVNLEMFFKTMSDCYTITSVLINHIKTKNK